MKRGKNNWKSSREIRSKSSWERKELNQVSSSEILATEPRQKTVRLVVAAAVDVVVVVVALIWRKLTERKKMFHALTVKTDLKPVQQTFKIVISRVCQPSLLVG